MHRAYLLGRRERQLTRRQRQTRQIQIMISAVKKTGPARRQGGTELRESEETFLRASRLSQRDGEEQCTGGGVFQERPDGSYCGTPSGVGGAYDFMGEETPWRHRGPGWMVERRPAP